MPPTPISKDIRASPFSQFLPPTRSLGTVRVTNNGIPVPDALVNWSVLLASEELAIPLLFAQSVTDDNGIAYME